MFLLTYSLPAYLKGHIYSIVLLMMGGNVTRNMQSKAIAKNKRNCCILLELFHYGIVLFQMHLHPTQLLLNLSYSFCPSDRSRTAAGIFRTFLTEPVEVLQKQFNCPRDQGIVITIFQTSPRGSYWCLHVCSVLGQRVRIHASNIVPSCHNNSAKVFDMKLSSFSIVAPLLGYKANYAVRVFHKKLKTTQSLILFL